LVRIFYLSKSINNTPYLFCKKVENTALSRDNFFIGCGLWDIWWNIPPTPFPFHSGLLSPNLLTFKQLGIDSASLCSLADGSSNRVAEPARQAGNRFLGFLKGLQVRAQDKHLKTT
jgi:hypothetical protein